MQSGNIKDLLGISRAPFLALTPIVLFPALTLSYKLTGHLAIDMLVLVFIAAMAAHIAVNALNEYQDFNSGLDQITSRTPFSGGSGTLPSKPWLVAWARVVFVVAFLVMAVIGGYLSWRVGREILPLGILGGLIILAYTRWLNRIPLACLVAPGVGFGLLMVNGTVFLMTGSFFSSSQYLGWMVFFLCNALLLLNQIPDIGPDKIIGRRHLPILLGARSMVWVYMLLLAGAYGSLVVGCWCGALPPPTLIACVTLPLGLFVCRGLLRSTQPHSTQPHSTQLDSTQLENIPVLVSALGRNVVLVLLTPLVAGVGILLG